MLYDAAKIAENLNISKVTAYAKMKLAEVKPFIILQNGKSYVDEKGLELIKQSLKYNQSPSDEETAATEIDTLKDDMINTLKNNIDFLKDQLIIKDNQIDNIKKLFENTQVLFRQEQEKNKNILSIPETIKEHDIELINTLADAMEKRKAKMETEKLNEQNKGFFHKLFKR